MSVEHGYSEVPHLIVEDISSRWRNMSQRRKETKANYREEHAGINELWPRARHALARKIQSGKNIAESAILGIYLAGEDPILTSVYAGSERHAGHFAAAAIATLSAYIINKVGTSLYQKKIMGKEHDDSQKSVSELYLSAHLLGQIGVKPHNIETLILGSYFGAEQEEKDLSRQNTQRIVEGKEPVEIDRKAIAEHHSRLFTLEYGALAIAAAVSGEAFVQVDHAINTALQPSILVPLMMSVYGHRYVNNLRGRVRTEPTAPMRAYLHATGAHDQLPSMNKESMSQGSETADTGDGVHFNSQEHAVVLPTKIGKEDRMKNLAAVPHEEPKHIVKESSPVFEASRSPEITADDLLKEFDQMPRYSAPLGGHTAPRSPSIKLTRTD